MSKIASSTNTRLAHMINIAAWFRHADIAKESALFGTKWFAYRFMSPWAATQEFAGIYTDVFQQTFRSEVDMRRAEQVSGVNLWKLNNDPRERTQMWKARQRADETGMRYDEYIAAAFAFGVRRTRSFLPRPSQLHYPNNAHVAWVPFRDQFWRETLIAGVAKMPNHPAYRVENFKGLEAQIEYRELLLWLADQSTSPLQVSMGNYVLQRRQMPLEAFAVLVPDDVFASRVEAMESDEERWPSVIDPLPAPQRDDFWPGCFGLPSAHNLAEPSCAGCELQKHCQHMAGWVSQLVRRKTGTATPADDHARIGARDRQRNKRVRDRETR